MLKIVLCSSLGNFFQLGRYGRSLPALKKDFMTNDFEDPLDLLNDDGDGVVEMRETILGSMGKGIKQIEG